jgi:hypothetical protein
MREDTGSTDYDQRRIVHTPPASFTNQSLLERLLPRLSELIPGNHSYCTLSEYESIANNSGKEDYLRHQRFIDFLKTIVGEETFKRFTGDFHRISYVIHPLYISIAVTGTVGPEGDTFSSTSVFNFTHQMLNRSISE